MGKNDVNQIADNVRVVHAGCGVNALSSLQNCAKSMDCTASVGLIRRVKRRIRHRCWPIKTPAPARGF